MGFTTGVTGGVTATLGLAYLAIYTHQKNREHQAQVLRSQTRVLDSLLEPVLPPLPPSRQEIEAARHANLVDTAKDRWNSEVANAVRWVQRTDWVEVREGLEEGTSKAWRSVFGGEPPQKAEEAAHKTVAGGKEVASEVKGAWERAKEKAAAAAEARVLEAQADAARRAAEMEAAAQRKASEARERAVRAAETARQEGKTLLQQAGQKVSVVAEKVMQTAETGASALAPAADSLSPVERTLQERYEQAAPTQKGVNEILAERYLPTDAQDHGHLRGI